MQQPSHLQHEVPRRRCDTGEPEDQATCEDEGYRIAERASRAFLSARIRETYLRKRELSSTVNSFQGRLGTELSTADYQKVMNLSYRAAERTHNETKRTQILKLERLANHRSRRRELRPEGLERWVVNLHSHLPRRMC